MLTKLKDRVLSFDEAAGGWKNANAYAVREKSSASTNYRVYLEDSARGSYANLVMVREARGFGTTPLFPPESTVYEAFPTTEEPVDFTNFTHGVAASAPRGEPRLQRHRLGGGPHAASSIPFPRTGSAPLSS